MKTLTAAIQFGSSRISAVAACINEGGLYEVVGIESVPTAGCIHRGCVTSIEETAVCIKSLMKKLSNRVKGMGFGDLNAAYVGVCGISMHSMEYSPSLLLNDEQVITGEIRSLLKKQSMELMVQGKEILGLKSNGEYINGEYAIANHQLILADRRLMSGIRPAMDMARIRIVDVFTTPLLIGDILNSEEMNDGCLLLDIGAQLTSISIYAQNALQYMSVLPLGSNCVNLDIATKGMRLEEAEELKVNWSNAAPKWSEETSAQKFGKSCSIPIEQLNLIVISRYDEIISNVANIVEKAGYKGLLSSCIVTGGASTQTGLTALLSKRLEIPKIRTGAYTRIRYSSSERKPHLTSLMAMLPYCTESCELKKPIEPDTAPVVPKQEAPTTKQETQTNTKKDTGKVSKGFKTFFGDLFYGLDDDGENNQK